MKKGKSEGEDVLEAQIAPVKYNRDAVVTIVSDDGEFWTGKMLERLGAKYHFKITVSGIVTWIEPLLKQWKRREKRGNIELISHSYTHLRMGEEANLSRQKLEHEITDSIRFFKEHFSTNQIAFIPPDGVMCEQGYDVLNDNEIKAVRTVKRGYNTLSPRKGHDGLGWYDLHAVGIQTANTVEERNEWVDVAIANKVWLIEMWHNVVTDKETKEGSLDVSIDVADEHLKYIAKKQSDGDIWVASMVDATKYLLEKQYATVRAVYCNSKITVGLTCDQNELPPDIYSAPLTVRVLLPKGMGNVSKAISSDWRNKVRIFCEEGKKTYLEFEMIPNGRDVTIKLRHPVKK